jgi:hypothetical protein
MSGAAALAAARRRRAAPQPNNPPPVPQTNRVISGPSQLKRPELNDEARPSIPTKINPTMMLMNHNKIIENLQQVISNLNDKVDNETLSQIEADKMVRDIVAKAIDDLKINEDNIDFFKNKYTKMEVQLNELKKHIIKVQTFAMETNLQCIELKKKIFRENTPKTMDQVRRSDTNKLEPTKETLEQNKEQFNRNTKINEIIQGDNNEIVE